MSEGKYKPYKDLDWYPAKISEERINQIDEKNITYDEFTCNDLVYSLSKRAKWTLHNFYLALQQVAGDETARKVAKKAGYNMGKTALAAWQKKFNTKQMNPEQWAIMQDFQHALGGFFHRDAFAEYDDKKCVVRRTDCGHCTFAPETRHLCKYTDEGFLEAYREMQPGLKTTAKTGLPEGSDICEVIFEPSG